MHTPFRITPVETQRYVGVRETVTLSEIAAFVAENLPAVISFLAQKGIPALSTPVVGYFHADIPNGMFDLFVGFFVAELPESTLGGFASGEIPACETIQTEYSGPAAGFTPVWERMLAWAAEHGRIPTGPAWETHLTPLGIVPAVRSRTVIAWPVQRVLAFAR